MSDRRLHIVRPKDGGPEHRAVCSVDGEPWPCPHQRAESRRAMSLRWDVRCGACGQLRNSCWSLFIERGADGRAIYFHSRKRCAPKAKQWWDENVLPHTGEAFCEGEWIGDLARHLGSRCKIAEVPPAPPEAPTTRAE